MGNFMSYYHTSEDSPFNPPIVQPLSFDPYEPPPMPGIDEVPIEIKAWTGSDEVPIEIKAWDGSDKEERPHKIPTWRNVFTRQQWKKHIEELSRRCRAGTLGSYRMTREELIAVHKFHNN